MLTTEQLATLKAAILADPQLAAKASGPGTDINWLAIQMNKNDASNALGWITNQPEANSDDAPDYSTFDTIQAGKRESWGFFLARPRDFTRNKVRKWVTDVWGNATAGSNSEAILLAATEKASRAEVLFGGNTKSTGTVSALDRAWIGEISMQDVADALAS